MRILIAGATGLIGQEIVKQCKDRNISIHYLSTSKSKIVDQPNYKGFYWNPSKNEIDTRAFEGVTAIINLAGATIAKRWTNSYKRTILNSRINSASLLLNTLNSITHQVDHYISASGVSIYPNSKTKLYFEENNDVDTGFLAEVVLAWEQAADAFKDLDIHVAKIRTGIVLAPNDGALKQMAKPIKLGFGAVLGDGEQWLSWIHITDIAAMYIFILENQHKGIFNAVAPNPVDNKKMTFAISDQLNKSIWLPSVPAFLLKLILGEMATLVLDGQLVSSQKIEKLGFAFQFKKIEKALNHLLT